MCVVIDVLDVVAFVEHIDVVDVKAIGFRLT